VSERASEPPGANARTSREERAVSERASEPSSLSGELKLLGRITAASNATFLCELRLGGRCVYKPVRGEQPLWDFPDGTLAGREVASYLVSEALGWGLIPETVLRDGPFGPGMVQRWIDRSDDHPHPVDLFPVDGVPAGYREVLQAVDEAGETVALAHTADPRLHRLAVLDVLLNNADRKGGHVLAGRGGRLYGVDHGICLHTQPKLRTVLWGWAGEPVADELLPDLAALIKALRDGLADALSGHLAHSEIAALTARAERLRADPTMPPPTGPRPIPWPAF
jgi:uncharacterized repeat protein (TIGR03843 family)